MKRRTLVSLTLVIVIAGAFAAGVAYGTAGTTAQQAAAKAKPLTPPTRAELLKLVNAERAKHGVAPLKEDKRLDWSAQQKADDEQLYGYFGHMHNGKFVGQGFITSTGIECVLDSENLHQGTGIYATAKGVVDGWIGSPAHHKAMVDPRYTLTGFGIAPLPNGGYTYVEHFCQP